MPARRYDRNVDMHPALQALLLLNQDQFGLRAGGSIIQLELNPARRYSILLKRAIADVMSSKDKDISNSSVDVLPKRTLAIIRGGTKYILIRQQAY